MKWRIGILGGPAYRIFVSLPIDTPMLLPSPTPPNQKDLLDGHQLRHVRPPPPFEIIASIALAGVSTQGSVCIQTRRWKRSGIRGNSSPPGPGGVLSDNSGNKTTASTGPAATNDFPPDELSEILIWRSPSPRGPTSSAQRIVGGPNWLDQQAARKQLIFLSLSKWRAGVDS